jgi:hypothetical protein
VPQVKVEFSDEVHEGVRGQLRSDRRQALVEPAARSYVRAAVANPNP